jgi:hypothetical protein
MVLVLLLVLLAHLQMLWHPKEASLCKGRKDLLELQGQLELVVKALVVLLAPLELVQLVLLVLDLQDCVGLVEPQGHKDLLELALQERQERKVQQALAGLVLLVLLV